MPVDLLDPGHLVELGELGIGEQQVAVAGLAAFEVGPEMRQFEGQPARQLAQVPSLKVKGVTPRSPARRSRTPDPTASTKPMNSWPIAPWSCGDAPR